MAKKKKTVQNNDKVKEKVNSKDSISSKNEEKIKKDKKNTSVEKNVSKSSEKDLGKKNVSKKSISRVERNKDIYDNLDLTITQQQQFNFEEIDLDSTVDLDTTFVDKKIKKKTTVSIQNDLGNSTLKEEKKKSNKFLIFILLLFIFVLIGFGIYHFMSFDHSKVRVVNKIQEKIVVDDNYLFLGDSITEFYDLDKYYEDLPVVNSGVSGDITSDILDDMENRVYRYNPSKVFILIGTNDFIEDKDNEEIIDNIEKIVYSIKENRPYCEIYLQSIYPINDTDEEKIDHDMVNDKRKNETIREVNQELKDFSEKAEITYIDMYKVLEDDSENLKLEYTKEGLHISEKGYEVITEELMKYIKD